MMLATVSIYLPQFLGIATTGGGRGFAEDQQHMQDPLLR